jgi:hypothetical protein
VKLGGDPEDKALVIADVQPEAAAAPLSLPDPYDMRHWIDVQSETDLFPPLLSKRFYYLDLHSDDSPLDLDILWTPGQLPILNKEQVPPDRLLILPIHMLVQFALCRLQDSFSESHLFRGSAR